MNPIWRMQNGQGPSWRYAQAKIDSEINFQVISSFNLISIATNFLLMHGSNMEREKSNRDIPIVNFFEELAS